MSDSAPPADAPPPKAAAVPVTEPPRSIRAWVSSTYFAEGLPYMMVRYLPGVYLTDIGVKELYLGFLGFLALPWNFKSLWAPALDIFGTKRGWLLKVEALMVAAIALMALCVLGGPAVVMGASAATSAAATASLAVRLLLVVLVVSAFLAATHDIAIDSYFMEGITDPTEQARHTGLRVMTYRLAIVFVRSALVAAAGWLSWSWSFLGAAIVLGLLLGFHWWYLPRFERPRERTASPGDALRQYGSAFASYFKQPGIALILVFVIGCKLGDEILFSMHTPFLMRGLGVQKIDLAWMQGLLGMAASIAGSLVSAWAIRRFGFRRAVWPLTLGMNLNIWVYVWLAWTRPDPKVWSGLATIAGILAYEQFAAGLGNAILMIYAMRTCKPEFKAAHFAIATGLGSIVGTTFGGFGGAIVERVGYFWLFIIAFATSVPSMLVIPFLPLKDEPKKVPPAPAS